MSWSIGWASEKSYKVPLGQEEEIVNLCERGGDSEKKRKRIFILKGYQEAFYFKFFSVSKETRERKLDFLFCSFHNTTV